MPVRSVSESAALACLLEAISPKPGNVHRGADFDDLTFQDLAVSAVILGQVFQESDRHSVGWLVRESQARILAQVGKNTYLGTILLLAPLAKSTWHCHGEPVQFQSDVADVLAHLTPSDAEDVYAAIRMARPGGMGRVPEMDVAGPPPRDLLAAMKLAEHRDLVARQYCHAFCTVAQEVLPALDQGLRHGWTTTDTVVYAHVTVMARHPDSLIARKAGEAIAVEAQQRAAQVLAAGPPGGLGYARALSDLDFWLRSDGHRRNPGTTADLIAAALFVLLRLGRVPEPIR